MPVIKVWCLPQMNEEKLNELHKVIVNAVTSVTELGLKDESEMTCLFPADMMQYGLGSEIIVEVSGLLKKPERNDSVRNRLAEALGKAMKNHFPKAMVECFVDPLLDPHQGFWTNPRMGLRRKRS